jgi:hypothetical protein
MVSIAKASIGTEFKTVSAAKLRRLHGAVCVFVGEFEPGWPVAAGKLRLRWRSDDVIIRAFDLFELDG